MDSTLGGTISGDLRATQGSSPQPDESAGGMEIDKTIVELLNKQLNTGLSLVEFDSLTGVALLQKLNDVFASLSPNHQVDIQQEIQQTGSMGMTLTRMTDFLTSILNYKVPPALKKDFEANFVSGEKVVIYPIMHWVLTHLPQAKKRVYLAKYLVPVDVPEDLRASDDLVREVYTQYKALVDEFIQTHRSVEQLRKDVADPQEVSKRIKSLEQEQETLDQRIKAAKDKLKNVDQSETLLKACQGLRQELDEQAKHADHLDKQGNSLVAAERALAEAEQTLRELKRDGNNSIDEMMRKMTDDVRMTKMLLEEKLPKDTEQKTRQLETLRRVLSEHVDVAALKQEIQSLDAEIGDLQKKKEEKMKDKGVQQLQLFRQQVTLTANRKAKFIEELQSTKEEINKVKQAIAQIDTDLGRYSNQKIPKGQEDFNKYANSLRDKSAKYRVMKSELNELRSEFGVLQRTEEILKGKVDLSEYQGILTTKRDLDAVNQQKHELDGQKSQTLEELSSVVQQFVADIRGRRNKLAPQILELRNTRQKAQVVEADYMQRKEVYENEQARLQSETGRLEDEVSQLGDECRLNESLFHRLHCQLQIAEVAFKRVQDEKDFLTSEGEGKQLCKDYKSWAEMFEKKTADLDSRSRELQKEKRELEGRAEENLHQMEWFKNLRRLLECKVAYYKREANEKRSAGLPMTDMGGVMMGDAGGMANVLVLAPQ
eukprot:Hpha_TRINITY_DN16869_c3_g1::TRINITY_DN16869_c3_g1_i1::g.153951::m.153951/K19677/IFT81; intraflagellar transport protein 81